MVSCFYRGNDEDIRRREGSRKRCETYLHALSQRSAENGGVLETMRGATDSKNDALSLLRRYLSPNLLIMRLGGSPK